MELPQLYKERMERLLSEEAEAYFRSLEEPVPRTLRLNRAKLEGELCLWGDMAVSPVGEAVDVYAAEGTVGGRNPLHHAGAYYIQEYSAMLPLMAAPCLEGKRVLDLCAAPGGKTGQLASLVGDGGFVVSNEYSPARARVLLGNVERMGYRNVAVYSRAPKELCPAFSGYFDLVLVDAPCSGEGMFRREADAVQDWSPENTEGCAARQREILRSAALAVAPGGYLLYSTCTFAPVEDEETVAHFLCEHPQFSAVETEPPAEGLVRGIPLGDLGTDRSYRAYPHRVRGEGQFFCLMRRDDSPAPAAKREKPREAKGRGRGREDASGWCLRPLTKEEERLARAFTKEFFGDGRELSLCGFGGDLFVLGQEELPTLGLMAPGVRLGTVQSSRLVPAHQFFSAFGNEAALRLSLSPEDSLAERYLRGEVFSAEEAGLEAAVGGWGALLIGGCSVGGFRLAAGQVKNHYPKGLRER